MSNALVLFGDGAQLPAHLSALEGKENILERDSTPILSFKGKVWQTRIDGIDTILTRKNVDGESEPTPIVKLVVLNINPNRSRTFYAGNYTEGKNTSPDCWSSDGTHPDKDVKTPCAATCAACPNSVKGSKITENNKETTACSPLKRIAVVPASRLDMVPMLLKIPQTSIWDKNNADQEAKGFFAWDQYVDFLRTRGVKHTVAVVTKVKFDPTVAYPKLLFTAERFLDAAELAAAMPLIGSPEVTKLLSGKIHDGPDSAEVKAAAVAADDDDGFDTPAPAVAEPTVAAIKPTVAKTKAPAPAAAAVATVDDDDDGFDAPPVATAVTAAPAKTAAAKPVAVKAKAVPENVAPAVATTTAAELDALAAEWDD